MKNKIKIFLTGHRGLVGSSIFKLLKKKGYQKIITIEKKELDLRNQKQTLDFFKKIRPHAVINAAAKVGGINANEVNAANFIYDNIMIQTNVIQSCLETKVKNLVFLGSSCVYPKFSIQPIKENYLLGGKLEKTNEAMAVAKISGIKMCEYYNQQFNKQFKCLMPSNIYGPNDNYNLKTSHFLPALIKKIYLAKKKKLKKVEIWGTGKPKRELLFVDDLANACLFFLFKKTKHSLINIGSGREKSITKYAEIISKKLNYKCKFVYNKKYPDGTPRKLLNINLSKKLGWKPKINLSKGLDITLEEFFKKNGRI